MANKKLIEEIKRKLNSAGSDQLTELASVMNKKSWTSKAPTRVVKTETDPMETAVASQISKSIEELNKTIRSIPQSRQETPAQQEQVRWISGGGGVSGAFGNTTDAAITSDTNGSAMGFFRGIVKMLADVWNDTNNYLQVSLATRIAGEDLNADVLKVEQRNSYATISTATTTTVKSAAGFVHSITVLGGTLGAITVYDNTTASGNLICPTFTPTAAVPCPPIILDSSFATGLTVVTAANTILHISYR